MKFIKKILETIKTKKFKYISLFWTIIGIQFVIGNNLQKRGQSITSFSDFLISILKIITLSIIFIVLHYSIAKLLKTIKLEQKEKKQVEVKHKWLIYFSIIIICWIPTLLAFYPGIISYDGGYQIRDFIFKQELKHHPILVTALYTGFYNFGLNVLGSPTLGMFLYSIFQMCFMATIFSYSVKFIEEETDKKWVRNISIIFYAIFPYNQLFSMITTKDVLFAGFTIIFILKLYKILKQKYQLHKCIYMILISVLMLLSRNNVVLTMKVSLVLMILIFIKDKYQLIKIISIFLITIIIYQRINGILYSSVKGKNNESFLRTSAFSQACGKLVKEKEQELTEDEKEKIDFYFYDYKNLGKFYKANIADSTVRRTNNKNISDNKKEFFKFMLELFMKYPIIFLDSYLNTTRGYWYIQDESFNKIWNDQKLDTMGALELYCFAIGKGKLAVKADSKIPALQRFYQNMFCRNEYRKITILYIVFQPAFYFYILIAYLLYEIYKRDKIKIAIGTFLFVFFASCYFANCSIVRYMYPIIVSMPILLGLVTEKEKEEYE